MTNKQRKTTNKKTTYQRDSGEMVSHKDNSLFSSLVSQTSTNQDANQDNKNSSKSDKTK